MIPNGPSIYAVGSSIAPSPFGERDRVNREPPDLKQFRFEIFNPRPALSAKYIKFSIKKPTIISFGWL